MSNATESKYKLVLGLEIHMHLKTDSKMFCGCDADIYEAEPNTHVCPVCLGLPGALPVPNQEAIKKTQLFGLALGCELAPQSLFDRKHYFYPDLPKGYQISQYKNPFCIGGKVKLNSGKVAELERIHLEEDTAKSFHEGNKTLIDFNKSGMPLMELVTTPCFDDIDDAIDFCKKIRDTLRYLGLGDGDMEKGQMRVEPNISLRTPEMAEKGELAPYKVEIKNINSFRFMEKAVKAEIKRQTELLDQGITPAQENRGYDEKSRTTVAQRSKEEASDYRYFPEPDIPPFEFDEEYIEGVRSELPKLLPDIYEELVGRIAVSENNARMLTSGDGILLLEEFYGVLDADMKSVGLDGATVANLILNRTDYRGLSSDEFLAKYKEENDKIDDTDALSAAVKKVLDANPKAVADYKGGKQSVIGFLVGMVMRETQGKADAGVVRKLLQEQL
jgi:aspartyl-tRNA(Asn)/glutamyl-tRNA(Gln) amidotransferase subunit B